MSTVSNVWAATKEFFTTKKRWRWFSLAFATVILAALAGGVWALNNGVTPVELGPTLSYLTEITPKYGVDEGLLRCLSRSDSLQASISRPTADKIFTWGNGITLEGSYNFKCFSLASSKVKVEWFLDGQKLVLSKLKGTLSGANVGKHRVKLTVSYDTFVDSVEKDFGVEVPNTAPTASITMMRPYKTTKSVVTVDAYSSNKSGMYVNVDLLGIANDAQDGPLSGNSVKWTTGKGAFIGYGTRFSRDLYTPNCSTVRSYTFFFTATDSKGATAQSSITIRVRPAAC
jgi:hypothetical protein